MDQSSYEKEGILAEYLLFHYGADSEILPYAFGPKEALHFPKRCAELCREFTEGRTIQRALDIGCAVGRSTFELARFSESVMGLDFSERFIQTARELREKGSVNYSRLEEGRLSSPAVARVSTDIDRERVRFERGDACNPKDDMGPFDVVLLSNVIDRLPDPQKCLDRLPFLTRTGGILVILSPYTWMTEFTSFDRWLGGYREGEKAIRTLDSLKRILGPAFNLEATRDVPFLIREHARKFQWSVAEATVWKRKAMA